MLHITPVRQAHSKALRTVYVYREASKQLKSLSRSTAILARTMSPHDDFVRISSTLGGSVSEDFFENTHGKRVFTEGLMVSSIRAQHPKHHMTVFNSLAVNLISFADSRGDASYILRNPSESLLERRFIPPPRRYNDENGGTFVENTSFGCYDYVYQGKPFLIYIVEGRDGPYNMTRFSYILVPPSDEDEEMSQEQKATAQKETDDLIEAASRWSEELHGEVLVFDGGVWTKNKQLWDNIQNSNWADVILEQEKKEAIIEDVLGFFDGEDKYAEFAVPWKVGLSYPSGLFKY